MSDQAASVSRHLPTPIQALAHQNFRYIWIGQFARGVAQWTQLTAAPLLVLHLGGSAIDLGILAALQFGPVVIVSSLAGVFADGLDKRLSLQRVQLVLAGQGAVLALLTATQAITIGQLFVASTVFGLANAFEMPIRQSLIAELVPPRTLPNAITLQQAAFNLSRMLAPIAAATLVTGAGFAATFALATGASLLSVVLLQAMTEVARRSYRFGATTFFDALRLGLRFVVSNATVRDTLLVLFGTTAFGLSVQTILPVFASDALGLGAWGYGALLATMALGAVIGATAMTFVGANRAHLTMSLALVALAVSLATMSMASWAPLAFALMATIGLTTMIVFGSTNITVQSNIEHEFRGRVMGFYIAIYSAGAALGGLFAGGIADRTDVRTAILANAVGVTVIGTFAAVAVTRPAIARVRREPRSV
jgi:MFS family permease